MLNNDWMMPLALAALALSGLLFQIASYSLSPSIILLHP
jgi:hypothetical protein